MNKTTQRQKIIEHCAEHGSITIREAFEKLHINSPSKRISEIRKSGLYDVQSETVNKINASGEGVHCLKYYISPIARDSI